MQVLTVEIEDHAAGRSVFLAAFGDHGFEEVRAVNKGTIENLVHTALPVAAGEGRLEFPAADGILDEGGLFVAVPEKFDIAGRDVLAGRHGDDGLKEGLRDRRAARVIDGNGLAGRVDREIAGQRRGIDDSAAGAAVGLRRGKGDGVGAGGEAVERDAPAALDHLIRLLGRPAVDRVGQVVHGTVGIFHRDDAGAFHRFAIVQIDKSQIGAAAIDVDCGGESLEERRLVVRATVKDTRLDSVQTFGNAGQIGDEAVMTVGDFLHLLETANDDVLAAEIRGRGVEVAALAPLEDDIVHQLAALRRLTVVDIDRGRVAGEARDRAGFSRGIASAGDDP